MINNSIKWLALSGLTMVLLGCASHWDKKNCQGTNWYNYGQNQGAIGTEAPMADIAKQCHQYGVVPNQRAYHQGYRYGLLNVYCTYHNGLSEGESGNNYNGQCPPRLERRFIRGWHQGLKAYCVGSVVKEAGRNGKPFPYWCPTNRIPQLRVAYNEGQKQRQRAAVISGQEIALQNQIDNIDSSIATLQSQGAAANSATIMQYQQQKIQLQNELYQLQRESASTDY